MLGNNKLIERAVLAQHGRFEEADRIVTNMERHAQADIGKPLPPAIMLGGEVEELQGSFVEIWYPPYRRRTIMLIIFNLLQSIGFYGFASWIPTLLISQGITITRSLEYTFIIAIVGPIGPLMVSSIADGIERKWQLAASTIGLGFFGLLFSQQTTATGIIVLGVLIQLCNACWTERLRREMRLAGAVWIGNRQEYPFGSAGTKQPAGASTKGDHHVATACADDR